MAILACPDFNDLADEDVVGADEARIDQPAVEGNNRIGKRVVAGAKVDPLRGGITSLHVGLLAREISGKVLVLAGQHIDAEAAVLDEEGGLG